MSSSRQAQNADEARRRRAAADEPPAKAQRTAERVVPRTAAERDALRDQAFDVVRKINGGPNWAAGLGVPELNSLTRLSLTSPLRIGTAADRTLLSDVRRRLDDRGDWPIDATRRDIDAAAWVEELVALAGRGVSTYGTAKWYPDLAPGADRVDRLDRATADHLADWGAPNTVAPSGALLQLRDHPGVYQNAPGQGVPTRVRYRDPDNFTVEQRRGDNRLLMSVVGGNPVCGWMKARDQESFIYRDRPSATYVAAYRRVFYVEPTRGDLFFPPNGDAIAGWLPHFEAVDFDEILRYAPTTSSEFLEGVYAQMALAFFSRRRTATHTERIDARAIVVREPAGDALRWMLIAGESVRGGRSASPQIDHPDNDALAIAVGVSLRTFDAAFTVEAA